MKVLKLTESDLKKIVKRVIKEQDYNDETRALAGSLWKLYETAVDEQLNPEDFEDEFEFLKEYIKYLLDSGVEEGLIEEGTSLYDNLSDYYYDFYSEYIFDKFDGTESSEEYYDDDEFDDEDDYKYDDDQFEDIEDFEDEIGKMNEEYDDIFLSIDDEHGWYDREDRKYDGDFDFDFDEEEIDSYDDLMVKYGDKQKWFAPERKHDKKLNISTASSDGRRMFDRYKDKYQRPFKLRKRRM